MTSSDISKRPYRLDDATAATIKLPDGRDLGYAEYGVPDGKPVLYLHGHPGARIEAVGFDFMAKDCGARVIAIERPGFGLSSQHPAATMISHVEDVTYLADALKLDKYGVMGISGGGPYAFACAAKMPADKLRGVTVMCGLGLPEITKKGMRWWHYFGFTLGYTYGPSFLLRRVFQGEIQSRLDLPDEERIRTFREQGLKSLNHPKEADFLNDTEYMKVFMRNTREVYRQGMDGRIQDGKLLCADPGFRIKDIRSDLPVRLWYGRYDNVCPQAQGEQAASIIGKNAQLRLENETHSSLYTNFREQALKDLTLDNLAPCISDLNQHYFSVQENGPINEPFSDILFPDLLPNTEIATVKYAIPEILFQHRYG